MDTHHNQIGSFSADEIAVLEAGRAGVRTLKKTIEIWFSIGRAVQTIRKQADALGGRNAFERLMEQEGFPLTKYGKRGLFQPATITRLLHIMEPDNFTRVVVWHEGLPDQHKIAWASPDSVFKHCPVFGKDRPASTATPKAKAREKQAQGAELAPRPDARVRELDELERWAREQVQREAAEDRAKAEKSALPPDEKDKLIARLELKLKEYSATIARLQEDNNKLRRAKGGMDRDEYAAVLQFLHPDNFKEERNKKRDHAFQIFHARLSPLLPKSEIKTAWKPPPLPRTREELAAAKLQTTAYNKAKRAYNKAKRAAARAEKTT